MVARQRGFASPGRERRDAWLGISRLRSWPAAPRPRGDRRRHAGVPVLRRHADDDPAARGRRVVGVAPRRCDRRCHRGLPVPPRGSATAEGEVQLGDRGRTGAAAARCRACDVRGRGLARGAGAVAARAQRHKRARQGAAVPPPWRRSGCIIVVGGASAPLPAPVGADAPPPGRGVREPKAPRSPLFPTACRASARATAARSPRRRGTGTCPIACPTGRPG